MRGIVLAAGSGTRLGPLTRQRPKTLLEVTRARRSILDLAVQNLASVGIDDVAVVVGHAAAEIESVAPELERRHGVTMQLVTNDNFDSMNNAYSLWCAREVLADGAILVNGDTVHPASVEERLMAGRGTAPVLLAVDGAGELSAEAMKVQVQAGLVRRITKAMEVQAADGEYIGVALVEAGAAPDLTAALRRTFEQDPSLYYEDGVQEFVDGGGRVGVVPLEPGTRWVEVDDADDLALARDHEGPRPTAGADRRGGRWSPSTEAPAE